LCEGRYGTTDTDLSSMEGEARRRAGAAIGCDAYEIMMRVASTGASRTEAETLYSRVLKLRDSAMEAARAAPLASSRLPLSNAHGGMYAVAAEAERAAGAPPLRVWSANPWAPLSPLSLPGANDSGGISVALMRGERRVVALNARNASETARTVRVQVSASTLSPASVTLHQVNWTGNDQSTWTAAELQELGDARLAREVTILPGVTQQIWIEIRPERSAAPGQLSGSVTLHSGDEAPIVIPLAIRIFRTVMPEQMSLELGGWDYTDDPRGGFAVTEANRVALAAHLQARHVDTPWAHSGGVLHWKFLGPTGEAATPVDATLLSRWVAAWPNARRYRVYVNVTDYIGGIHVSNPNFSRAVSTWAHAWAAEIRRLNKSPEQFDLSLVDEPRNDAQAARMDVWAQAVRAAGAGFQIWLNPFWRNPFDTPERLIELSDIVSINVPIAEQAGAAYWEWGRELVRRGKRIEVYFTDGPARRLDPYRYFRLAAWRAFAEGAANVSFWCFSDTGDSATTAGESPSDNEFAAVGINYSPLFINRSEIRAGKHMEAAVAGIQDVEYLHMLRKLAQEHPSAELRAQAGYLLERSAEVLRNSTPISSAQWRLQTENSAADRWRIAIGEFLDLAGP
jgi:hypothetical protein